MPYDNNDIIQWAFLAYQNGGTQKIENGPYGAVYIGYAEAGTAVTLAKWQIRKITYDSNGFVTDIQFADGTNGFTKVWNDRATYTYS